MNKRIFIGMLLIGGLLFLGVGSISAFNEEKPYEGMTQFREDGITARELGIDKDAFIERREDHREQRMNARRERMEEAGCFTAEEIEERIQIRRGRFAK